MSEQCKARVMEPGRALRTHQCERKAQRDGWCWQHHPDAEAERARQSKERWNREMDRRTAPRRRLEAAQAEIARLTEQRDALLEACEQDVVQLANLAMMVDPTLTHQLMEPVYAAIAKARGNDETN